MSKKELSEASLEEALIEVSKMVEDKVKVFKGVKLVNGVFHLPVNEGSVQNFGRAVIVNCQNCKRKVMVDLEKNNQPKSDAKCKGCKETIDIKNHPMFKG